MNFVLFLVLNAILLLRPEELFPELAGARIYLITIVACVLASLPGLTARLTPGALQDRPIGVCVLGIWVAGFVSHFAYHFRPHEGLDFAGEFGKVVLYYFLFVAVVDTPARFRVLTGWLLGCVVVGSGLAVMDYHGYLHFPGIVHAEQGVLDPESGEVVSLLRLTGSGIYGDPNDLCLALCLGMLCSVYLAISGLGVLRLAWLLPIAPLMYAFTLTHSRGGMIGLLAGVAGWLCARYGGRRALPVAAVVAIGLLAAVGGRQANLEGGGTAHQRLMFWAQGFTDITRMPMYLLPGLGVGYFEEEMAHVAHNSFVSAYIETGLLGGGFFLGAFYIAGRLTYPTGQVIALADWTRSARPFVFAAIVAYAAACYSLSRQFVLPTYITLGLASAYLELAHAQLPYRHRVSAAWFARLAVLSVVGFLVLKFATQGLGLLGI